MRQAPVFTCGLAGVAAPAGIRPRSSLLAEVVLEAASHSTPSDKTPVLVVVERDEEESVSEGIPTPANATNFVALYLVNPPRERDLFTQVSAGWSIQ